MKASASPISAREGGDKRLLALDPSPVPSIVPGAPKVLLQRCPECQWAALFLVEESLCHALMPVFGRPRYRAPSGSLVRAWRFAVDPENEPHLCKREEDH